MNIRALLNFNDFTIKEKINTSSWAVTILLCLLVVVVVTAMALTRHQVITLIDQTERYMETSLTAEKAGDLLQFVQRAVAAGDVNAATEYAVRSQDFKSSLSGLQGIDIEGAMTEDMDRLRELYTHIQEPLDTVFEQLALGETEMAQIDMIIAEELYTELVTGIKQVELALSKSLTLALVSIKERMLLPIVIVILVSILVITVSTFISRRIRHSILPLDDTLPVMDAMAHGDLSQTLMEKGNDEVTQIAKSLNRAIMSIRDMVRIIDSNTTDLSSSSNGMREISVHINDNAQITDTKTVQVSDASNSISSHVESIVMAVSQLKDSIHSVSKEAHKVVDTVSLAVDKMAHINEKVLELDASNAEISNVTKIISDIAAKTNLLALNAAIEAARAGEAGRGFAIVANEVKALSGETATATRDIGERVKVIQEASKSFINAISDVTHTIQNISNHQTAIASAVEEQTTSTEEIYSRLEEAENITVVINNNIIEVIDAARNTKEAAESARDISERLAAMSDVLRKSISTFKF